MLTTNEINIASTQGWEIAELYDTRGFFVDAIVPTKGSKLTSPFEARKFVWETAKRGDPVCRHAWSITVASELNAQAKKKKTKRKDQK